MYSTTPALGRLWLRLLETIARRAAVPLQVIEHGAPAPIGELWSRPDLGAVLMCGLPFSRSQPRRSLVVAPVPSPPQYRHEPCYWSEFVVAADSPFAALEETFGHRIAFTTRESQSGYAAALYHLIPAGGSEPLYRSVVAPCITPLGALSAVTQGQAEVAPVDSFALDHIRRHAPEIAARIRPVATTERTAIPAFVASQPPPSQLVQAFLALDQDTELSSILDELLIERFALPIPEQYESLRERLETVLDFWGRHPFAANTHPAFML